MSMINVGEVFLFRAATSGKIYPMLALTPLGLDAFVRHFESLYNYQVFCRGEVVQEEAKIAALIQYCQDQRYAIPCPTQEAVIEA